MSDKLQATSARAMSLGLLEREIARVAAADTSDLALLRTKRQEVNALRRRVKWNGETLRTLLAERNRRQDGGTQ